VASQILKASQAINKMAIAGTSARMQEDVAHLMEPRLENVFKSLFLSRLETRSLKSGKFPGGPGCFQPQAKARVVAMGYLGR
jgi:hypothetical protein